MRRHIVLAGLLATCSAVAAAGPAEDFAALQKDYYQAYLRDNPLEASYFGVKAYDRELGKSGPEEAARQVVAAKAMLARLDAIPAAGLAASDRVNHAILRRQLQSTIDGSLFGANFISYSSRGTLSDNLGRYLSGLPLRSAADFDNYLERLAKVGPYLRQQTATDVAIAAKGYARPCSTLAPLDKALGTPADPDPARSAFYEPFTKPAPASVTAARWAALQDRARQSIASEIVPAMEAFRTAYGETLRPKCLASDSVTALPDGKAQYDFLVRYHTTTGMTPDQIHTLGLREVARIRAEMEALARKSGFPSRDAMIADMRTNPRFFAKTPEELMMLTARMTKRIDGQMPALFGRLPRLPYTIKEIPAAIAEGTTTAYYDRGSPEAGLAGIYFVNTSKLDQRPLWEIPALTVHEAVPGHHHQIALQQELDMPDWRKNTAYFTAFSEGWGLYSERLGIEMGLYDTPQNDMGRLGYEMWRAARLVVDTGLHAKGWDKARAVAFMKDNTTLTDANVDAEVNRYISGPGQALAYKLGELKIRELRALAEKELGAQFDLRDFHDAVLLQGAVPLDTLEAQVRAWINAEKTKP